MNNLLVFLSLSLIFPLIFSLTPQNVTVVNNLREFTALSYDDERDYFLSKNPASVEQASKVCETIGERYHLVSFENDSEFRRLLPYLRSVEIPLIWTSGVKFPYTSTNSSKPKYSWTRPFPISQMNYTNFPSSSMLQKLAQFYSTSPEARDTNNIPRCKNGFLSPKCNPGKCNVTLEDCSTTTPPCKITEVPTCHITRPECGATCNNCTITESVCHIQQEPCSVITPPCKPMKPICTILTPKCETFRPPCMTLNPPCEVTTPKPCTTTRRPCATTQQEACTTTQPPCSGGKCPPPVTFCKQMFKCVSEPEICQPGAIICPPPIITCPPEQTICHPPEVSCTKPTLDCPTPIVDCPPPKAICLPPKITCDSPEVNCPGIVVNCPSPAYHCPTPIVTCPPPSVDCDPFIPCEIPEVEIPCPDGPFIDDSDEDNNNDASPVDVDESDDAIPSGCIALRKETDFKWKLQPCTQKLHFICEGR